MDLFFRGFLLRKGGFHLPLAGEHGVDVALVLFDIGLAQRPGLFEDAALRLDIHLLGDPRFREIVALLANRRFDLLKQCGMVGPGLGDALGDGVQFDLLLAQFGPDFRDGILDLADGLLLHRFGVGIFGHIHQRVHVPGDDPRNPLCDRVFHGFETPFCVRYNQS